MTSNDTDSGNVGKPEQQIKEESSPRSPQTESNGTKTTSTSTV